MAQEVITLAKQETSEDILERVKNIELIIPEIYEASKLGGGLIREYIYIYWASGSSDVNPAFQFIGKGVVKLWVSNQNIALKSIDNFVSKKSIYLASIASGELTPIFQKELTLVENTTFSGYVFFVIDWANEKGSMTTTATNAIITRS